MKIDTTANGITLRKLDHDSMITRNKFDQLEKDCLFTKEQVQEIKHDVEHIKESLKPTTNESAFYYSEKDCAITEQFYMLQHSPYIVAKLFGTVGNINFKYVFLDLHKKKDWNIYTDWKIHKKYIIEVVETFTGIYQAYNFYLKLIGGKK